MTKIWALLRQSGSDRLEKQPTDLRQNTSYFGDRTLVAGDEDAREEILWDLISSVAARTKYQDSPTSSETEMMSSHDKTQNP
jgi:hypothetical protein